MNSREIYNPLLSYKDKQNLFNLGTSVAKKILEDYPTLLPDLVIFPDIAARPLYYLFRPVFLYAASARGVALPKTIFVNPIIRRPFDDNMIARDVNLENYAKEQPRLQEDIEDLQLRRKVQHERAMLVRNYYPINRPIIITEYVNYGSSLKEIARAFELPVPAYALIGSENVHHYSDAYAATNNDPYWDGTSQIKKSTGFHYRTQNRAAIGVLKQSFNGSLMRNFLTGELSRQKAQEIFDEERYNESSKGFSTKTINNSELVKVNIRKIREEMSQIGRQILDQLN